MTEIEAKGFIQGKLDCMKKCDIFNKEDNIRDNDCDNCEYCYSQGNFGNQKEAFQMAINALEKQKKIKEAFEMWRNDTGGIFGADDETMQLIRNLKQILNGSDEMPTLDEIIVQERKTAEHNHNMYEFECMCYGKDTVDSGEKMDCVKEYDNYV